MTFKPTAHTNLEHALREAYAKAPCGIYYSAMELGWVVYDLTKGCKDGLPDFMVVRPGALPIVLNEDAEASLLSLIRSKAQ